MNASTLNNIRAEFIAESILKGLSFEEAVEKSFNQVNDFLMSLINDSFNSQVFEKVKSIV